MRNRNSRKGYAGEIARWCHDAGVKCEFSQKGKHPHARISFRGQSKMVFFPSTPGDRRGRLNILSTVRRTAKEIGWKPGAEVSQ